MSDFSIENYGLPTVCMAANRSMTTVSFGTTNCLNGEWLSGFDGGWYLCRQKTSGIDLLGKHWNRASQAGGRLPNEWVERRSGSNVCVGRSSYSPNLSHVSTKLLIIHSNILCYFGCIPFAVAIHKLSVLMFVWKTCVWFS